MWPFYEQIIGKSHDIVALNILFEFEKRAHKMGNILQILKSNQYLYQCSLCKSFVNNECQRHTNERNVLDELKIGISTIPKLNENHNILSKINANNAANPFILRTLFENFKSIGQTRWIESICVTQNNENMKLIYQMNTQMFNAKC